MFGLRGYLKDAALYHYPHFDAPLYSGKPPLVITIQDLHPLTMPGYTSSLKRTYFKWITGISISRAKRIITISEATAREIIRFWPRCEEKITIVPLAVSSRFSPRGTEEIAQTKSKYGLPGDYLFYIGNPKPHKNLQRLLEAYGSLPKNVREKHPLVIAGVKSKQELPEGNDGVIVPGFIAEEDLPAVYSGAILFLFPSYAEGFGLPPLEAAACGASAAVARAASIPEVMGDAAFYFDPFDINDIRNVIERALTSPGDLEAMAAAAKERAASRNWDDVARDIAGVYREVI